MTQRTYWRRHTVSNGAVDLAVFEGGNPAGPTLVMVHGWPDTHQLWEGVATRLGRDFHLVSYDTRGHGASTVPGTVDAFRLEAMAEDFWAVVDAVSPEQPVHVLGHDWGSVQVWEAICRPGAEDRISSFVSISGPSVDHVGTWLQDSLRTLSPRRWLSPLPQAASSAYLWFFISPLAPTALSRLGSGRAWSLLLRLIEGLKPAPGQQADTLTEDMVSGLRIYRANVLRLLREPRERRTSVPVLQIEPSCDVAVRRGSLRAAEPWVDHLERQRVPHGHWVALTHPEVVADLTVDFVGSLKSAELLCLHD